MSLRSTVLGGGTAALALRGALAALVFGGAYVFLFAWGARTFESPAQVTATVPASAGALKVDSAIQYRGVNVGRVERIDAGTRDSLITLGFDEEAMASIPADVQVRLMPRTVFGDYYVDLVSPESADRTASGPALRPGGTVQADQSEAAVQLYQAFSRIYELVGAIDPADLNAALTAVATALDGEGERLGESLDALHRTLVASEPVLDGFGDDLDDIAELAGELDAAAPDVLATLDNSITVSRTIVEKQQGLAALLAAGTRTAEEATALGDNRDRIITLVDDTDGLLDSLTARPGQITTVYQGLRNLVTTLPPAVASGPWLNSDLTLSAKDLQPYWKAQCPTYGDLEGPSCTQTAPNPLAPLFGGTVGPVGSPAEKSQISRLFGTSGDLESVMAGPILRGTTVVR